jgi:hypothetical protein
MKGIIVSKEYTITYEEGELSLSLTFHDYEVTRTESNLPYNKNIEHWKFYAKAISQILKAYEKEAK